MYHATYAAEMNGKSLAQIAQDGGHEFYIRTKKLAEWRAKKAAAAEKTTPAKK